MRPRSDSDITFLCILRRKCIEDKMLETDVTSAQLRSQRAYYFMPVCWTSNMLAWRLSPSIVVQRPATDINIDTCLRCICFAAKQMTRNSNENVSPLATVRRALITLTQPTDWFTAKAMYVFECILRCLGFHERTKCDWEIAPFIPFNFILFLPCENYLIKLRRFDDSNKRKDNRNKHIISCQHAHAYSTQLAKWLSASSLQSSFLPLAQAQAFEKRSKGIKRFDFCGSVNRCASHIYSNFVTHFTLGVSVANVNAI